MVVSKMALRSTGCSAAMASLGQQRHPIVDVQCGAHTLQLESQLNESHGHGWLDADHHGASAEQPSADGNVVKSRPKNESRVSTTERSLSTMALASYAAINAAALF